MPGSPQNTSPVAVVTGLTYNFVPFMVLPLYASLEKIDLRLIEASQDLYANGFTSFRKITLPLSLPGLADARAAILDELVELCVADEDKAREVLG